MTIELPQEIEAALKRKASLNGVSAEAFVRAVIERELEPTLPAQKSGPPFKSGYGILAKYGPAPTNEEMEENRRDMWKNFGENF
jgi:hypothetical protein